MPLTSFSCFLSLPTELRLKIWHHSFHSRVLELHSFSTHHADNPHNPAIWYSNCANHPALFACVESRREALSYYAADLPVARTGNQQRLLYLNPESDMIVALGGAYREQIAALLYDIKGRDPLNRTPKRVSLGLTIWLNQLGDFATIGGLPFLPKELLDEMNQLVLLMYGESTPPADFWNGECVLESCKGWDPLWRILSKVDNRRCEGDWTVVDNVRMRIMNLGFVTGKGQERTSN